MTKHHLLGLCVAAQPLVLAGCAGTSNALLVSSTNVGIDIDTKPPQAEVSISRKELAVQPGFEGGETLPAVMSFSTKGDVNFLTKLFVGITSTFSTGRAAVALTSETGESGKTEDDDVVVSKPPVAHRISDELRGRHRHLVGPGEMRPLVFGTKTIFGLHAAWDGAQYVPSELKVGFNRKEAAYAPVGYRVGADGKHYVQVPSTLATLDNNSGSVKGGGSFGHTQYFATGRAATNMAKRQQIRDILIKRIEPAVVEEDFASDSSTSERLDSWLQGGERKARIKILKDWIKETGGKYTWSDLVSFARLEAERAAFLADHPNVP